MCEKTHFISSNWFCIIQIRKENLTDPFIWENLLGWRVNFIVLLLPSKLSENAVANPTLNSISRVCYLGNSVEIIRDE